MRAHRVAFVMEQALGHVTHYRNLREFTERHSDTDAEWLPIPFGVNAVEKRVPFFRNNWSVRASWRARRALGALCRQKKPDALLFHTQVTSLFSVDLMRRIPTVVSLDATPINYDSLGTYYGHVAAGNGFLDRKKFEMNRRALTTAAGLIAWSEWARQSLIDDYGVEDHRIRVLPPGAAPAFFELGRQRTPSEAVAANEPVRILFVGADFERKGGQLLLDFMRQSSRPACELHLVTQSDVAPQPDVHVYRGLSANSPQLLELFRRAEIFVLPTHADCLGVALMEAAAAGLPSITTDVGALREAVHHGETGFVIPRGDRSALAGALVALASDADARARMGKAAFSFASRYFDAEQNNRALVDFVSECVSQSPAQPEVNHRTTPPRPLTHETTASGGAGIATL